MSSKPPTFRPGRKTARQAKQERDRIHDRKRAKEQPWRTWYNTPEWRAVRAIVLTRDPACVMCLARGRVEPSRVADHKEKDKKYDRAYFFNPLSCQGLCFTCHNSAKQRQEKTGSGHGDNSI
jgi:hypothetical protein